MDNMNERGNLGNPSSSCRHIILDQGSQPTGTSVSACEETSQRSDVVQTMGEMVDK